MCVKPLTINGYEVSCRECDQCVATYKNSWVSRCVAEKQTLPHAYAITLTYADVDGEPPLGARVYRYKDVSDFWKRIRSAAKRKWKDDQFQLRYVIVGELGTKFGRCHYHGVVFATHPIIELGEISGARTKQFAYRRRLTWTLWGHGFVEFQPADRKGMSYALKYILKSRMTAERSKGNNREGKTEWLASSYLWCSKVPAVGATWLFQKLDELTSKGMCPPALRVRVPGGGDWYVTGKLQKDMCLYLHEANNQYREERGRDLAGWTTLLATVQDDIENSETGEMMPRKPKEWLTNGEEEEEQEAIDWDEHLADVAEYEQEIEDRKARSKRYNQSWAAVRRCGHILPCEACRNTLGEYAIADLEQEYNLRFEQWKTYDPLKGRKIHEDNWYFHFERWWLTRLRPSRGCQIRDDEVLKDQFFRLKPWIKGQRGLLGKAAVGKTLQGPARQQRGPKR